MPARGWLQRVRHNTYTVCYVRLVADHHLLVVPHSPRPAHLIRTVILHNYDYTMSYFSLATLDISHDLHHGTFRVGGSAVGQAYLIPGMTDLTEMTDRRTVVAGSEYGLQTLSRG